MCHMYLWNLEPFSISIRPVGPDGLRVMCTCEIIRPLGLMAYVSRVPVGHLSISIRPVGPNGLRVTCCHWSLINSN
jgi:hypothetical protein